MKADSSDGGPSIDPKIFLAAETTLLAWSRTGIALMGFGFVVARFGLFLQALTVDRGLAPFPHTGLSHWFGTALILVGVVVLVGSGFQHTLFLSRVRRGEGVSALRRSSGLILSLILGSLGVVMAVYVMVVG